MEDLFGSPLDAIGPIDFTHATPVMDQPPDVSEVGSIPLPSGEGTNVLRHGASLGTNTVWRSDAYHSAPLSVQPSLPSGGPDVSCFSTVRGTCYDPFSEEGDHEWMLHQEEDALFSQDPDADFFSLDGLVF